MKNESSLQHWQVSGTFARGAKKKKFRGGGKEKVDLSIENIRKKTPEGFLKGSQSRGGGN